MAPLSIVFINLKPPYELKASTLRLASPGRTSTIQQILIAKDTLRLHNLLQVEYNAEETDETEPKTLPCTTDSFTNIFDNAHTVVLPDSLFMENSRIFNHTQSFLRHGVQALQSFYQNGGTVLVQCVEGGLSSACATQMNTLFGTDWKVSVLADDITLGPTPTAEQLFNSPYLPKEVVLKNSAFYVSCPINEGLYQVLLPSRQEFEKSFNEQDVLFERLGIEMDKSMSCFDVEKSWDDYIEKYSNQYGIAIHQNEQGAGHIIWYGDRSQTNRTMSFIFCKLLNVGVLGYDVMDDVDVDVDKARRASSFSPVMLFLALFAVIMAVVLKLYMK
jgi:hypothetical protein